MRKFAAMIAALMLFSVFAFGQTRTVNGVVKDDKGVAIPFATIRELNTRNGTQADVNGLFSIKIQPNGQLALSSVGFTGKTVNPGEGFQTFVLSSNTTLSEVMSRPDFG